MTKGIDMTEHVILVAVTVEAPSREAAERNLHAALPEPGMRLKDDAAAIESWWIAEDDRRDRSDCDSAVFVPAESGMTQAEARTLLELDQATDIARTIHRAALAYLMGDDTSDIDFAELADALFIPHEDVPALS